MIQVSCDMCGQTLDPDHDLRYVVKLEVYAAIDPLNIDDDDDRDGLQELDEIIERIDDAASAEIGDDVYMAKRFDLCPECRKRFMANPLGRKPVEAFNFSDN